MIEGISCDKFVKILLKCCKYN